MTMFRNISLGTGIILAIFGFIIFVFPNLSLGIFATLLAFGIMIVGANATYTYFATLRGSGIGIGVLITGILCLVFGLFCLLYPYAFGVALEWFVAGAVIAFGIMQLIGLVSTPDVNGRFIGILGSLVVIVFGILAFVWPETIMLYVGISLFVDGVTIIIMSCVRPKA